jgi:hypothetical protein
MLWAFAKVPAVSSFVVVGIYVGVRADCKGGLPKGQIAAGGLELAEKYGGVWVD